MSSSTPWRAHDSRLPCARRLDAEVVAQLVVDVDQRRRQLHAVLHREAQAVRLLRARGTDPGRGSRRGWIRTASGAARRTPGPAAGTRCGGRVRRRRTAATRSSTACRTRHAAPDSSRSSPTVHFSRSSSAARSSADRRPSPPPVAVPPPTVVAAAAVHATRRRDRVVGHGGLVVGLLGDVGSMTPSTASR